MKKKEQLVCDQTMDALDGKQITRGVHIEVTSTWLALCWELNAHIHNFPNNLMIRGNMYKADVITHQHIVMNDFAPHTIYEVYPNTIKKLTPKQKESFFKKKPPRAGIHVLHGTYKMLG